MAVPPDLPLTIPAVLDRAADTWPDDEALVDGDLRLTWGGLRAQVDRAAAGLLGQGLRRGDVVALWAPNCGEWVIACLALQRVGAVVATLNTRFLGAEAAHAIRRSGARWLVTVSDFLDIDYVERLRVIDDPPALDRIVIIRGAAPDGTDRWEDLVSERPVDASAVRDAGAAIDPDDACDIIFTSGTTGPAKAALMGHARSIRTFWEWSDVVGLRAGDRYLIINPFFHSFGLKAGILACILRGATIVPLAVLEPTAVADVIERERISMLPGPPAIYQTLLDAPELAGRDLSSLRLAVTGSAPVPERLVERMRDEIGFEVVVTGYGLTESHGVVTMNRHDDPPALISRSDGRAIEGVEVRIVDETGADVPAGTPGEVWARTENLMLGYLGDPEQTKQAIDDDGWLHTGDVAVMDEDGNLRITDRLKDIYISGGFNVSPSEVESLLAMDDRISRAAVVGVPDDRMGEVGAAFVVPRPGIDLTPDEVIAWARTAMANYKVPRIVHIVDSLPLSASNKVRKDELTARIDQES